MRFHTKSTPMASLVLDLQSAAMDSNKRVDELLRLALVVSTKLGLDELRIWCENELKGYGKTGVPRYRVVRGELKARNPYHGWVPVIVSDSALMKRLTERPVGQSVSELEYLLANHRDGGSLHIPLPHDELLAVFGDTQEFHLGMVPTLIVGASEVHGIVAAIRDSLLEWSLRLEKEGILGDNMTFSRDEVARAAQLPSDLQSLAGIGGNADRAARAK